MSLLGSQVFASSDTPCWISAQGGTVTGTLTVDGNLSVDGSAQFFGGGAVKIANPSTLYLANTGQSQSGLLLYSDNAGTPNGYAETNGTLYLGRVTAGNTANSTFVPSAPTTNGDVLTIGGRIASTGILQGPSVTPSEIINATKVITPVPTAPTTTAFAVDTPYPTVIGQTYEISAKGRILLASGTPAVDDVIYVTLTAGATYPGTVWIYPVFPSATNVNGIGLYDILTRVKSDQALPSITVSVSEVLGMGSTAVYQAALFSFSATRVA